MTEITAKINMFEHFIKQGFDATRLIPIIPPDAPISAGSLLFKRVGTNQDGRGKTPGVRGRDGLWHSFDWLSHKGGQGDTERWHSMGAGVGIKTGDGLVAIDADTLCEVNANIIRDIVADRIGALPIRIGNFPKTLYLCRVSAPYRYTRVDFGARRDNGSFEERVEILSNGKQFVASGVHPKTLKPYYWKGAECLYDNITEVTPDQLDQLMEELRTALPQSAPRVVKEGATTEAISQKSLTGDVKLVTKAVEAIPNTSEHFPTRESYRDFGYAIKAALPDNEDVARGLFLDWCARWVEGENDIGVAESDWGRMKPPFRRGASWLYEMAERLGGGSFSMADVWFDDTVDEYESLFPVSSAVAAAPGRFKLEDFDDAVASAFEGGSAPIIKGLLDQGSMSVLYGASHEGKTFVALDMAYHVAVGEPYSGMRVNRGLVVYVAAEGGRGAKRRLVALRDKFQPKDKPWLKLLGASVDFLRPEIDLNFFLADIKAIGVDVSLIVIDTLSRAIAGGDENSSTDMGAFVRNIDLVRSATGAHVMVVHHTGKDKAKGARGHSLLRAATDTEIEVDSGCITVTKQRDMDNNWSGSFTLEPRIVGVDYDGDPISSCTVKLEGVRSSTITDDKGSVSTTLTPMENSVMEALQSLIELQGSEKGASVDASIKALMQLKMSRAAALNHIKKLRAKGKLTALHRGFINLAPAQDPKIDDSAIDAQGLFW